LAQEVNDKMAIDKYKLGWNTGGKIVFGTNPFYANKTWDETSGVSDLLSIDVLMTGGEVSRTRTPSVETMASIGEVDSNQSRVKVLLADGVQAISGSISFTCDKHYMQSLLEYIFTKRKRSLSLYIGTENFSYIKVASCNWTSISITCGEGALLACSISVLGNKDFEEIHPTSAFFNEIFKNSNIIPYWQTGVLKDNDILKITSWTLTINQAVTPAYLNTADLDLPAYLRIGNWDFLIDAQMLTELKDYNKIQIGVTEALNPIILTATEFVNMNAAISFGGIDAMGSYSLGMELVAIPDSYTDNASISEPFTLTFT